MSQHKWHNKLRLSNKRKNTNNLHLLPLTFNFAAFPAIAFSPAFDLADSKASFAVFLLFYSFQPTLTWASPLRASGFPALRHFLLTPRPSAAFSAQLRPVWPRFSHAPGCRHNQIANNDLVCFGLVLLAKPYSWCLLLLPTPSMRSHVPPAHSTPLAPSPCCCCACSPPAEAPPTTSVRTGTVPNAAHLSSSRLVERSQYVAQVKRP